MFNSKKTNKDRKMSLLTQLQGFGLKIQQSLFPFLETEVGPLTEKQMKLVMTLEILKLETHIRVWWSGPGRPPKDRLGIARAFVAKSIYDMSTTRILIDRLRSDVGLRRICGFERIRDLPSESGFSRAFAEFSKDELLQKIHQTLIKEALGEKLIGHISRDSTAIEAREKPAKKEPKVLPENKGKKGRPKKGEEKPKEESRLQKQVNQTLPEMLEGLPTACDIGTKKNSKGYKVTWQGYKLHLDVADGDIPVSCILTAASVHDSQASRPLAIITSERVTNLYDVMDSAYCAKEIMDFSLQLGHVPLIDINPRRDVALKDALEKEARSRDALNFHYPEEIRFNERSSVERVNGRLKDEFGGRHVRVRSHAKVFCHLMFGVLVLTVAQLFRMTA
jgi:hypothetical protein